MSGNISPKLTILAYNFYLRLKYTLRKTFEFVYEIFLELHLEKFRRDNAWMVLGERSSLTTVKKWWKIRSFGLLRKEYMVRKDQIISVHDFMQQCWWRMSACQNIARLFLVAPIHIIPPLSQNQSWSKRRTNWLISNLRKMVQSLH